MAKTVDIKNADSDIDWMKICAMSFLFDPPLDQWGYRADPILWKRMARDFALQTLPLDEKSCKQAIIEKFQEITGAPLYMLGENELDYIKVPEFTRGGMSSGLISLGFWRDKALPELLSRFRHRKEREMASNRKQKENPFLIDDVVKNFALFFSGQLEPWLGLGALKETYTWQIPEPPINGMLHWPKGSNYEANVHLKLRLNELWLDPAVDRLNLAKWVISKWGGVRGNRTETLLRFVQMAETDSPNTPMAGVASYSKLLSVAKIDKYAIYDARVAVALNAAQLLMDNAQARIAFPYLPGRNKITGDTVNKRGFSQLKDYSTKKLEADGWTIIPPSSAYQTYMKLLRQVQSCFSDRPPLYDLEMTLFSQATKLALAVEPRLE